MDELLPPPSRATVTVAVLLGVPFLFGLGMLTLWPSPVEDTVPGLLDRVLAFLREDLAWSWLGFTTLEVLANILVFVPVGILAFVLMPRRAWPLAFGVGPAASAGIELVQRTALPDRAATIADVLANSAGATLGVSAAVLCTMLAVAVSARPLSPTLEAS